MAGEKKNSVLIVDDERANLIALTHILSPQYTIYAAKDGQSAIETAKEHIPDLILLDVLMPDMDGYDVIVRLKELDETKNIPVIFVTGLSGAKDEEKGLALGASDYISKPFGFAIVNLRVKNQMKILNQIKIIEQLSEMELNKSREELKKALAASKAANNVKSIFLANMSHELRTPLNAIAGMTSLGKSSGDIERKNYCFSKIETASDHILGLINNILDTSKIESGRFELSCDDYIFQDMIQWVINVVRFPVDEKRQKLTVELDENIPEFLLGDSKRLSQVILNLLSNAIKFTSEGGSINLNACLAGEENGILTLEFKVSDTGVGISQEQQDRMFESFYQADETMSRKFEGAGLGLTIAKSIVNSMEGEIWVESKPNHGSTFVFTVKTRRGKAKECAGKELLSGNLNINDFNGRHILVADDVDINREIVAAMLEPVNLKVDCAEDGFEVIRMFREAPEKFDMIFMDIQMPGMDGFEATRRIRELDIQKAKTIPIVAMTANIDKEDIGRCISSGMNGHIGKPLYYNDVLDNLCKFL